MYIFTKNFEIEHECKLFFFFDVSSRRRLTKNFKFEEKFNFEKFKFEENQLYFFENKIAIDNYFYLVCEKGMM